MKALGLSYAVVKGAAPRRGLSAVAAAIACCVAVEGVAADTSPKSVVLVEGAVSSPLTSTAGDPAKGAAIYVDRGLGNCLACHANKAMEKELFHGNVGPSMDGVAERYSVDQLRAIVVNAKQVFGPETIMPGFYTLELGANVRDSLSGKTILSAQQAEDLIAYLTTLK